MSDETLQPTPEPAQSQTSPEAPVGNAEPIPAENPISEPAPEPSAPQEPTEQAPIPPTESVPAEIPPEAPQATPNPESAILDKDQNPANEPFPVKDEDTSSHGASEPASTPQVPGEPNEPNITIEKHGNDVTITEVMKPEPEPKTETAQMAGNEPLNETQDEQTKRRKENLERANAKRQEKKREKINEILNLFSEKSKITNDEVEKLLHVSDATATRYLETLEKEGKIKQVGKTGKSVGYEKI